MEKDDLPAEQSFTQEIVNRMEEKGCSMEEVQLANSRNIERKRLKEKVDEVNKVLAFMETKDTTHTNELLLAAGRVVAKRLGVNQSRGAEGQYLGGRRD